jgi:perosamine synthetase
MKLENIIINKIKKVLGKKNKYSLHEPSFFGNEKKYLLEALKKNYVSSIGGGEFICEFENKIKNFTKAKYCISVINGTEALHLSLIALGVKNNDEVLLPSLTFSGTANAVMYCNAIPHFVDSELETLGIDPAKLENYLKKISIIKNNECYNKKTNRRIRAIIPVHIFGNVCKIDEILKIANKYKLKLLEDSAESLGSFFHNKHTGIFGDIGCISFNGNKIITTGGGGAIITNDKSIAQNIRHLSSTAKIKHQWEYIHDKVGYNFRMPNLNAALGLAQIENLNKFLKIKRRLFNRYYNEFKKIKGVKFISEQKYSKSNYWLITIFINNSSIKKRNKILKLGHKNKIFLRPAWKPLHTLRHFKKMPKMNLAQAIKIYKSCINLPSSVSYFNMHK